MSAGNAEVSVVTQSDIHTCVIHPIVLLSVVDHYNRVAEGTQRRVCGVLLGSISKDGIVDITNSYAGKEWNNKKKRKEKTCLALALVAHVSITWHQQR